MLYRMCLHSRVTVLLWNNSSCEQWKYHRNEIYHAALQIFFFLKMSERFKLTTSQMHRATRHYLRIVQRGIIKVIIFFFFFFWETTIYHSKKISQAKFPINFIIYSLSNWIFPITKDKTLVTRKKMCTLNVDSSLSYSIHNVYHFQFT